MEQVCGYNVVSRNNLENIILKIDPDYSSAIDLGLARLQNGLSPRLLYHSFRHTQDDVLVAARNFALFSQLDEADTRLLEVAAVFHDTGFLFSAEGHEQKGADFARELLPGFGFSDHQMERICNMIMATRLPQTPHNLCEELLADADLDVLGRDDFIERNMLLREEIALQGKHFTDQQWFSSQLKFVESHSYFSEAARTLRGPGKLKNIALLRQSLEVSTENNRDK